ncbi:hypothetical protein GCM10010109_71630 [Actinoplanes campanulatus]|nr:hypothetical protein GCM10010109_71630 [Actinoplanes campanulatus]GID34921.1 hypothetical protein Aca09nite_14270 [Actinoplanes campanulatus]
MGRLLRLGIAVALAAVALVGVTGFLRNNEILQAQTAVLRSQQVLGQIGELRAVVQAEPVAQDAVRLRVAELGEVAGADPVYQRLLPLVGAPAPDVAGMRAAVEEMRRHEETRLDRGLRELGAVSRTNRWLIVWVSVVAALAVLIGGRLLVWRCGRTAGEIAAAARGARPAPVDGPRELAELATAWNESLAAGAAARAATRTEAAAAHAAGSAFVDAMRQEIRTPMTALTGMTGLLLETPLDTRQRALAETVHASGSALLTVVGDRLDLAAAEAGDLVLERRPFALRGCVRRALEPVAGEASAKGLRLEGRLAPGCPEWAGGDERWVRRILTALLRPAVAGTGHGTVTVTVSEAEGAIRFAVADTGLGVPAERHSDAGVLLAGRLAEAMGGGITTEYRPGEGATVTVSVHLDEVEQPERSGEPYAEVGPGPRDSEPDMIRARAEVIAGPEAGAPDRRRLAGILHRFADRLPGVLDRMDRAVADGDTRNLARLAHGLKASAATLGANRFAALCADLEDRAHHAHGDPAPVLRDLHERAREVGDSMESVSRRLTRSRDRAPVNSRSSGDERHERPGTPRS